MSELITVAKHSLNSRSKFKCTKSWPCKRMSCLYCHYRRRWFFVERGLLHAQQKKLNTHVIVTWPKEELQDAWDTVINNTRVLSKTLSGCKAGPFIRVISTGSRSKTPHVHYLVNERTASLIKRIVHKTWLPLKRARRRVIVKIDNTYKVKGLLGYFFDQNFIPACLDPNRIKGIRILSASRPMRTCFPLKRVLKSKPKYNQDSRIGSADLESSIKKMGTGKKARMAFENIEASRNLES